MGNAGAQRLSEAGRQMEHGLNRGAADIRLKERRRMGNDRHQAAFPVVPLVPGPLGKWQKVGSLKVLGREDAVHGLQRELAPVMQKIGDMRLSKPGLPGQ
jgi:hypothetical protein